MDPDRTISQLLDESRKPLLSFEFFPPKDGSGMARLRKTARALEALRPDFVTVTYGAGGSTRERTAEVCGWLRRELGLLVMPHLTCVGSTRGELEEIADRIYNEGFRNIMTIRGDPPRGQKEFTPYRDGLRYGSDLVALLKEAHPEFCLGVGGYPETHPEAVSAEADIEHLKIKVDAGAAFITTQLFFENDVFYRFVDRCASAGISAPIIPGIMPVLSLKQIKRITVLCGSMLPKKLVHRLEAAGDDPGAVEAAGISWAAEQVEDLRRNRAPGIHLYVLNRARAATELARQLRGEAR